MGSIKVAVRDTEIILKFSIKYMGVIIDDRFNYHQEGLAKIMPNVG